MLQKNTKTKMPIELQTKQSWKQLRKMATLEKQRNEKNGSASLLVGLVIIHSRLLRGTLQPELIKKRRVGRPRIEYTS